MSLWCNRCGQGEPHPGVTKVAERWPLIYTRRECHVPTPCPATSWHRRGWKRQACGTDFGCPTPRRVCFQGSGAARPRLREVRYYTSDGVKAEEDDQAGESPSVGSESGESEEPVDDAIAPGTTAAPKAKPEERSEIPRRNHLIS